MTVPTPIGSLYYDEARAVRVRDPEDHNSTHSAVHSGLSVLVETQLEAQAVLASWRVIMQAAADEANSIIHAIRSKNLSPEAKN